MNLTVINHTLTPQEVEATNEIPADLREYVIRRQQKIIKNLDESVIRYELLKIIAIAFTDMTPNGVSDDKILTFQAGLLREEIKGKFESLTLAEVKDAFKKGIRREYGDYFGLCPATYHKFIKCAFEDPKRGKAWLAYLELVDSKLTLNKAPNFYA